MKHAALYMRSSKDKADIGLETQRRELRAFAKANGLHIAKEYEDMEISGSLDDSSRPGLNALLVALRSRERKWDTVLALDPSRISRDVPYSHFIQQECAKFEVTLKFAHMPLDPTTPWGELALNQERNYARFHAAMSGYKGRMGLMTNISLGYRAGGRAPIGYRLKHFGTGALRGGLQVRKSKLVLDPKTSGRVAKFLKARAQGTPRYKAALAAGLEKKAVASLIAMERNALQYAGFTVWNTRQKLKRTKDQPRQTAVWRPRNEWVVSEKATHPALITKAEAERILADVDVHAPRRYTLKKPEQFLLTGFMFTPDGKPWQGDGAYYRVKREGRGDEREKSSPRLSRLQTDIAVLRRIGADVKDSDFAARAVNEARRVAAGIADDPRVIDEQLEQVQAKIDRLTDAVAETGNKSLVEKLGKLERDQEVLRAQRAECTDKARVKTALLELTPHDIAGMLGVWWPDELEMSPDVYIEYYEGKRPTPKQLFSPIPKRWVRGDPIPKPPRRHKLPKGRVVLLPAPEPDIEKMRRTLRALVERVEMDPETREFQVSYRLPVVGAKTKGARKRMGQKVATPRGFEPRLPP